MIHPRLLLPVHSILQPLVHSPRPKCGRSELLLIDPSASQSSLSLGSGLSCLRQHVHCPMQTPAPGQQTLPPGAPLRSAAPAAGYKAQGRQASAIPSDGAQALPPGSCSGSRGEARGVWSPRAACAPSGQGAGLTVLGADMHCFAKQVGAPVSLGDHINTLW